MMNEQLQGELLSVHENKQAFPGAPTNTSTPHEVMNVLMGDGGVRSMGSSISLATWRAIITPAGDETLELDSQ